MAGAVRAVGSTFNTTSGTKTVVITPAVGDYVVVFVANSDDTGTPTVTDNNTGGTYTHDTTKNLSGSPMVKRSAADHLFAFVRDSLVPNTTSTTITMTPGTTSGGGLFVFMISGITRLGLNAVRGNGGEAAQAPGSTPAPVMYGGAITTSVIVGIVFNATNPAALTPPSGFTERHDVGYATPTEGAETASIDSGFTGSPLTWGGTSASAYCDIALEIDSTAAPAADEAFPYVGGGYYPFAALRRLWQGWSRQRDGLWAPPGLWTPQAA